jgi:hypothetical protein
MQAAIGANPMKQRNPRRFMRSPFAAAIGGIVFVIINVLIAQAQTQNITTEQMRQTFAAVLETELLKKGLDVRVSAQPPKREKLLMLGNAIDRVLIFNLISHASLLETAQERGFKTIQFMNMRPGGGTWLFDLSKPGPAPKCSSAGPVVCRE